MSMSISSPTVIFADGKSLPIYEAFTQVTATVQDSGVLTVVVTSRDDDGGRTTHYSPSAWIKVEGRAV